MPSKLLSLQSEGECSQQILENELDELYFKLRRYCQFITGNKWDSEDLLQEALLKLWNSYRQKPELNTALVKKIAYNGWIDTIRKRNRESLQMIPEQTYEETDQILKRFEVVDTLLTKLTPKQSVILTLKEAFLYQNSEIAEVLNMSESGVKAVIYRAKQRLARCLNDDSSSFYSEQTERDYLRSILQEALYLQNPHIIFEAIPFIKSLESEQMVPKNNMYTTHRSHSSIGNVYMAA